jgi:hypothetical protein
MSIKNKLKISQVTAFVSLDENGNEGVLGAKLGETFYPLICADDERIQQMFPIAEDISKTMEMPYRVLRFSAREDVTEQIKLQYSSKAT